VIIWIKQETCPKRPKSKLHYRKGGLRHNYDLWSDRDGTGNVRLSSSSSVRKSPLFRPNRRRRPETIKSTYYVTVDPHARPMTCDVSKTKPTNFVSCGPIGTGSVPFVFLRPAQSEFRVEFVKKWTRERQRPLKRLERQPVYCNRRPKIREQAICLLQPSTRRPVDVARVRPMTSPSFSYFTSSIVL